MTRRVHFPQTTSAVRQKGQRELLSALIFRPSGRTGRGSIGSLERV
jgi:hypothetical protein